MLFNFGRFLQSYGFTSKLDGLLEKPETTLEDILNEDNILMELKNSSAQKFATFVLKDPASYHQLLSYVVNIDEANPDTALSVKYPFMVSEVFYAENAQLIDHLFADDAPPLLAFLLSFLRRDALNVTAAGYFNKVLVGILKRHGFSLWKHLVQHPAVLTDLVKHVDNHHIADLLEKLILLDTNQEEDQTDYLEHRQLLITRLVRIMKFKSHQAEVINNIAHILTELSYKSVTTMTSFKPQLIEALNQPNPIFEAAVINQCSQLVETLINILEFLKNQSQQKKDDEEVVIDEQELCAADYSSYLPLCKPVVVELLRKNVFARPFKNTFGQKVTPLTQFKLQLLNLIYSLIQTKNPQIIKALAESKIFNALHSLLVLYPFNNFIQITYEKILQSVFFNEIYQPLQQAAIEEGMLNFIIQHNTNGKHTLSTLKFPVASGLQGILTKVSNMLVENSNDILKKAQNEEWNQYVAIILETINKTEKSFLCGVNPRQRNNSDNDISGGESEVQKILERFQQFNRASEQQSQNKGDEEVQQEEDDQKHDEETLEEKMVDEKIAETITSPKSDPREFSELLDIQEKLEQQHHEDPEKIEQKSDSEVNEYWKHHDDHHEETN